MTIKRQADKQEALAEAPTSADVLFGKDRKSEIRLPPLRLHNSGNYPSLVSDLQRFLNYAKQRYGQSHSESMRRIIHQGLEVAKKLAPEIFQEQQGK